jgi:uncharacterized protein (TIGR00369 family)
MFHPEAAGWKEIPVKAFFRTIGPLYARRDGNGWEYGLLTTEAHDNSAGAVHGGVLATFADQAMSTVAWQAAGRKAAATVSLDLHFAAPVVPGNFITLRARLVRAGRSLIFLSAQLACEGNDIAIASGVWRITAASS